MSSPTPPLAVEVRPSRLYAATLLALAACVLVATPLSNLPLPLKSALALFAVVLLLKAWRDERIAGLRSLRIDGEGDRREFTVCLADGSLLRAAGAGHAWLGTVAIFVFLERDGWRRHFGPRRLCILRDAVTADDFRRLRARLALG